jgi:hypothetical protein
MEIIKTTIKLIVIVGAIAFGGTYLLTIIADKEKSKASATPHIAAPQSEGSVGNESDISAVKSNYVSYRILDMPPIEKSLGAAVTDLAGIDGTIKWETPPSDTYKHNHAVFCVQAVVDFHLMESRSQST